MGWEQDLIFHTILKISSCSFKYECREVWTFCNFQFELRTESSIFHLILNIALQSILLFTFISHNDTRIKASNVSNFNEACEWLSIAICLMVLLSQIAILERMRSIVCCQSFMRCGILVYHSLMPPQNCHASYYDFFLDLCLKCFCKLKQLSSTCIVFNRHQSKLSNVDDQSLQPLLWHSFTNFFITWIMPWMCWKKSNHEIFHSSYAQLLQHLAFF